VSFFKGLYACGNDQREREDINTEHPYNRIIIIVLRTKEKAIHVKIKLLLLENPFVEMSE